MASVHIQRPPTATELEGISGPGDSGGPAFIEKDGKLFVAGVSVFGEPGRKGRGTYGAREAYTRVSQQAEWLSKTMSATANQQAAQATTGPPKLPDTPAAKRLLEVLSAIETDDGAKVRAFIQAFSKAFLDQIPEPEHLTLFERIHDPHGSFDVVQIERSTPYSIVVIARGKKTICCPPLGQLHIESDHRSGSGLALAGSPAH